MFKYPRYYYIIIIGKGFYILNKFYIKTKSKIVTKIQKYIYFFYISRSNKPIFIFFSLKYEFDFHFVKKLGRKNIFKNPPSLIT